MACGRDDTSSYLAIQASAPSSAPWARVRAHQAAGLDVFAPSLNCRHTMACRERSNQFGMDEEERTGLHDNCVESPLFETCEGCVDPAFGVGIQGKQLQSKRSGGLLCVLQPRTTCDCRASQCSNRRGFRKEFMQHGQVLWRRVTDQTINAGDVAGWSIEARDGPNPDRVPSPIEDDWYLRCLNEPHPRRAILRTGLARDGIHRLQTANGSGVPASCSPPRMRWAPTPSCGARASRSRTSGGSKSRPSDSGLQPVSSHGCVTFWEYDGNGWRATRW